MCGIAWRYLARLAVSDWFGMFQVFSNVSKRFHLSWSYAVHSFRCCDVLRMAAHGGMADHG
jgi:hypothetical protein